VSQPDFNNDSYIKHCRLLCASYRHWTGRPLVANQQGPEKLILELFEAPYVIVSHGTEDNPVFNFGNKAALELFELDWNQFIKLPSRESVETTSREERGKLMARVSADGYISHYSGVRISSSGKRFLIKEATIWNVVDKEGTYFGQAAMFENWSYL
jgi:MEKHLA domain-containing protein